MIPFVNQAVNRVVAIDVDKTEYHAWAVCINEDGTVIESDKETCTFKRGIRELIEWINTIVPQRVLLESTGIHHHSLCSALENAGIPFHVVNARHVRLMEGNKTDKRDAAWLARVALLGTYIPSFIQHKRFRDMQILERRIVKINGTITAEKNRVSKALAHAGFRLNNVFSDIHAGSGAAAVEALLHDKTPEEILPLLSSRIKATQENILGALEGELTIWHKTAIQMALDTIKHCIQQRDSIRKMLKEVMLQECPGLIELMQTLPGVAEDNAIQLLVELNGGDLSKFANADKLASWLGICPGNDESGGKRKNCRIRKGNGYIRIVLVEAAHAAVKCKGSTWYSKYDDLRGRKTPKKAIIAIAHKMIRMIYLICTKNVPYRDPHIDYEMMRTNKNASRWIRQLLKTGEYTIARKTPEAQKMSAQNPASTRVRTAS